MLITFFALMTADWIAFGPGERKFGGSFSDGGIGGRLQPGAFFGRAVFAAPWVH